MPDFKFTKHENYIIVTSEYEGVRVLYGVGHNLTFGCRLAMISHK